jgi:hypothetical protein
VAAVGVAVAEPGPASVRVRLLRHRDGRWRLESSPDLASLDATIQRRCVEVAATVVNGANLCGTTETTLRVDDGVRWVDVHQLCTHEGRRPC